MKERNHGQTGHGNAPHEGVVQPQGECDQVSVELEALAASNADLQDRLLRALAEVENTRRRAERSAYEARQYAIADFARELLPVADNLDRALEAAKSEPQGSQADSALVEGVDATRRMLASTLEKFGVRKIDALGARFDPAFHEAMMEAADDAYPPGTVAGVVQDGYLIHDRLLRPARVIVSERKHAG